MTTRIAALSLVLVAWIGLLAGVARFSDAAPAALVLFPGAGFGQSLPPGIAITSRSRFSLTLQSDAPALAARLYTAGAWLVLPAGLAGCLPAEPA